MKTLRQYQCELCKAIYDKRADAAACEAQGTKEPIVAVGDFVTTDHGDYGRFGWFDGDPAWVIEKPRGLHGRAQCYSLIYVVTMVAVADETTDSNGWHTSHHDLCYHVATKGMSGQKGYTQGFTFPETHVRLRKVTSDISAGLDASDLIGQRARYLL